VAASLVQSAAAWLVDFGLAPDPSVAAEIPYDPAEGYFHFFGGKAMRQTRLGLLKGTRRRFCGRISVLIQSWALLEKRLIEG